MIFVVNVIISLLVKEGMKNFLIILMYKFIPVLFCSDGTLRASSS